MGHLYCLGVAFEKDRIVEKGCLVCEQVFGHICDPFCIDPVACVSGHHFFVHVLINEVILNVVLYVGSVL